MASDRTLKSVHAPEASLNERFADSDLLVGNPLVDGQSSITRSDDLNNQKGTVRSRNDEALPANVDDHAGRQADAICDVSVAVCQVGAVDIDPHPTVVRVGASCTNPVQEVFGAHRPEVQSAVDFSIRPEMGRTALILPLCPGVRVVKEFCDLSHQVRRFLNDPSIEIGVVESREIERSLRDDISTVDLRGHEVRCDTARFITRGQTPVVWMRTSEAWKRGRVEIDGTSIGNFQRSFAQYLWIGSRKQDIG